jgi:hypothetical protein
VVSFDLFLMKKVMQVTDAMAVVKGRGLEAKKSNNPASKASPKNQRGPKIPRKAALEPKFYQLCPFRFECSF